MRPNWIRYKKWCVILASGGITPGILQGFNTVNWASLLTSFLIQWLAVLVTLLFGGQTNLTSGGTGTGLGSY